jgi:MraZ protein
MAGGSLGVALFVSTFINKVDRKGRVSVPAPFRAALNGQSFHGIVAYRSLKLSAIEASGQDRLEDLVARLDQLPEMSDERNALTSILPDMQQIAFDGEGRIMLPPELAQHAGIGETAAFVGLGRSFQIWEPARFERHQAEMRALAVSRGLTVPPRPMGASS